MVTQLTPDMHGKRISCTIHNVLIKDAMIVYYNNYKYFLLHNHTSYNGDKYPGDYQGYKNSWGMSGGSEYMLNYPSIEVSNIVFKDTSPEIY